MERRNCSTGCGIMAAWIEKITSIVKDHMAPLQGSVHSFDHVQRVYAIATFLAKEEKADLELVQMSALLHDVGRALGEPHNETGAKRTDEILTDLQYPPEKRDKIVRIVLHHPLRFKGTLRSLEEQIIWDADKLDLLGVIGVARVFHFYGALNRSFDGAVKYCHDQLRSIPNFMHTPTAKNLAERRHREAMSFLSALDKELAVTTESVRWP